MDSIRLANGAVSKFVQTDKAGELLVLKRGLKLASNYAICAICATLNRIK